MMEARGDAKLDAARALSSAARRRGIIPLALALKASRSRHLGIS